MRLAAITVRPDVVLPTGLHGRTVKAGAAELTVASVAGVGRVFAVVAKGHRVRYYLPHAVESFEAVDVAAPLAKAPKPPKKCAICPTEHTGSGETCSRSCAAKLRHRRAK